MTWLHKVIFALTGLLIFTALIVYVSGNSLLPSSGSSFSSESTYEKERAQGTLPPNSPDLPSCAKDVAVTKDADGSFKSATFTCDDTAARNKYMAEIKNGFDWNIFQSGENKIEIERVVKKQ